MKEKTEPKKTDVQVVEDGKQVIIEAMTRAEAKRKIEDLYKQAKEKGLDVSGGFIAFNYEKVDTGEKPFSAKLTFNDPKSI